jgi:uncharacterized protein YbjT (DUF2867 family)
MLLVIGATGTIGTRLVTQLTNDGHRVRVLTRNAAKANKLGTEVEVIVGDLDEPGTLRPALAGVERFFLITSSTQQDRNAVTAAREAGVQHVVKISTQEAGWTPVEGHGHWHKEREELIRGSGLKWTFLRPSMYMTFALTWSPSVRREHAIHVGGGTGKLPPVDPWDVAAVAKAALTSPSGHENVAYELTGPELLSFGDMAAILSKLVGHSVQHVDLSNAAQSEIFTKMGLPKYAADGLVETFSLVRAGRFAYLTQDVEKVTGHKPRSFETWAREHLAAFA